MKLIFFGHAAWGLESDTGERLVLDPYRSGGLGGRMNYSPIQGDWDWVMVTHSHDDHNAVDTLSGKRERDPLEMKRKFNFRQREIAHDEYEGERFGGVVNITRFEFDGFKICHLSDVGCSPSSEIVDWIGPVDFCLLPVGGFFTVGPMQAKAWWRALNAKVTLPMHYKTESVDLNLEPVDNFLSYFSAKMIQNLSEISIQDPSELSNYAGIVVLSPLNQK